MPQVTLRIDEDLAEQLKRHAASLGRSVNGWVVAVLRAAIDPDLADSDVERTRARLARAGLLAAPRAGSPRTPPDQARLRAARGAAGKGTPLSDIVSDGRR